MVHQSRKRQNIPCKTSCRGRIIARPHGQEMPIVVANLQQVLRTRTRNSFWKEMVKEEK